MCEHGPGEPLYDDDAVMADPHAKTAETPQVGVGDLAQLNSGGPAMTVMDIMIEPITIGSMRGMIPKYPDASMMTALCAWFNGGDLASAEFPLLALKQYEAPPERF